MPIYTKPRRRQTFLEEIEATPEQVFGAVADDALTFSPTSSILRMSELSEATKGKLIKGPGNRGRSEPDSPKLDAETARSRVKEAGVVLAIDESGIPERALDIMIERKQDEKLRQFTIAQGPGGVGFGAQKIGVMLAASMLDPINIGSAFVPVVGPARYASMLAKTGGFVGRTGVRARVGAVEGLAGAAIVEPVVLGAARFEQADYDSTDSFLNVAFGSVFGGGLHVMGGAAMDATGFRTKRADATAPPDSVVRTLSNVAAEEQEAMLRTSVAHLASGQNIDVEPLYRTAAARQDARFETDTLAGRELEPQQLSVEDVAMLQNIRDFNLGRGATKTRPTPVLDILKARGGVAIGSDLANELLNLDITPQNTRGLFKKTGGQTAADTIVLSEHPVLADNFAPDRFAPDQSGYAREEDILAAVREESFGAPLLDEEQTAGLAARADLERAIDEWKDRRGITATRVKEVEAELRSKLGEEPVSIPRSESDLVGEGFELSAAELRGRAEAVWNPENGRLNDLERVGAVDEQLRTAPSDENMPAVTTEEAVSDVQTLARQMDDEDGNVSRLVADGLAELDELEDTATAYGKAVRALAECQIRRG